MSLNGGLGAFGLPAVPSVLAAIPCRGRRRSAPVARVIVVRHTGRRVEDREKSPLTASPRGRETPYGRRGHWIASCTFRPVERALKDILGGRDAVLALLWPGEVFFSCLELPNSRVRGGQGSRCETYSSFAGHDNGSGRIHSLNGSCSVFTNRMGPNGCG